MSHTLNTKNYSNLERAYILSVLCALILHVLESFSNETRYATSACLGSSFETFHDDVAFLSLPTVSDKEDVASVTGHVSELPPAEMLVNAQHVFRPIIFNDVPDDAIKNGLVRVYLRLLVSLHQGQIFEALKLLTLRLGYIFGQRHWLYHQN